MNIKLELAKTAVKLLSTKTTLLPQATQMDNFISTLLTGETHEERTAKALLAEAERLTASVRKANTNRKFKKIIQHI